MSPIPPLDVADILIQAMNGQGAPGVGMAPPPIEKDVFESDKKFRERSFEYATAWMAKANEHVKSKAQTWKLLEDLYRSRRPLSCWHTESGGLRVALQDAQNSWRSDETVAVSPIVNSFVHKAFRRIFPSKSDYLEVKAAPSLSNQSQNDIEFSVTTKLTRAIIEDLREGHFRSNFIQFLLYLGVFGASGIKTGWFEREITSTMLDPLSGRTISTGRVVIQCPKIYAIKPQNLLLDWNARDCNVQAWPAIGDKTEINYYTVMERFNAGTYKYNRKEVEKRWKYGSDQESPGTGETVYFTDTWSDTSISESPPSSILWAWEFHGKVPNKKRNGWTEVVMTVLTDQGADSPSAGVLVRLQEGTIINTGYRPYVYTNFLPVGEVFSPGQIEPNLNLIHSMSTLLNIMINNSKVVNRLWLARKFSPAYRELNDSKDGDIFSTGRVIGVDEMDDIKEFPVPGYPAQEISSLYQYLQNSYERKTMESDTTLGLSQREKTATEASVLAQMASTPYDNIVSWIDEDCLYPLGKLFMAQIQQFADNDRIIEVPGRNGQSEQVILTAEEVQNGAYWIEWLVDLPDQMKVAKAQSLERALPALMQLQPMLAQEGYTIDFAVLLRRYLGYLGIERIDQVIRQMTEQEQAAMFAAMGPPPEEPPPGEPSPGAMPPPGVIPPDAGSPPMPESGGTLGDDAEYQAQLQEQQRQVGQAANPYGE